jgi:hypothetical protein
MIPNDIFKHQDWFSLHCRYRVSDKELYLDSHSHLSCWRICSRYPVFLCNYHCKSDVDPMSSSRCCGKFTARPLLITDDR